MSSNTNEAEIIRISPKGQATIPKNRDATLVVGADDDFDHLPVEVDRLRFRDDPV